MVYHDRQFFILQYVIYIGPRKFDTADIKCLTVLAGKQG